MQLIGAAQFAVASLEVGCPAGSLKTSESGAFAVRAMQAAHAIQGPLHSSSLEGPHTAVSRPAKTSFLRSGGGEDGARLNVV